MIIHGRGCLPREKILAGVSLYSMGLSDSAPEVSVIVPARNEEACLADCLQSLAGQTGPTL